MRKIVPKYFSLMKNLKLLKKDIQKVLTFDEINNILKRINYSDNCILYSI